jgi:hypothetical protein
MKLFAKNIKKEKVEFEVNAEDTMQIGTTKLMAAIGLDPEQYVVKIVYTGKVISNDPDSTFASHRVKDGDTIIYISKKKQIKAKQPKQTKQIKETVAESTSQTVETIESVESVEEPVNLFDMVEQSHEEPDVSNANVNPFAANPNAGNANAGVGVGVNGMPNIQDMVQAAIQNPAIIDQLMNRPELVANLLLINPTIRQMQQNDPEQFTALISNPAQVRETIIANLQMLSMMQGMVNPNLNPNPQLPQIDIQMTEEDQANIDQIVGMGFDRQSAILYYAQTGQSTELTIQMLIEDREQEFS